MGTSSTLRDDPEPKKVVDKYPTRLSLGGTILRHLQGVPSMNGNLVSLRLLVPSLFREDPN